MAFFEDLGKKITNVSQSAVEKTKNSTESIRLNNLINEEERKLNSIYIKIAKQYIEKYGENPDSDFISDIQDIKNIKNNIEQYKEQVRKYKKRIICKNCGKEIPESMMFCDQCGMKNPVAEHIMAQKQANTCHQCGAAIREDSAFCSRCGAKRQEVPPMSQQSSNHKFCSKCGTPVQGNDISFCTNCGNKLSS